MSEITASGVAHESACGHVTGAAPFISDIPRRMDELCVGFVGSHVACGVLRALHLDAARAVPGVVAVLTSADLPAARRFGPLTRDEAVLADGQVLYFGQPAVIIAAESSGALQRARALVRLEVEETPAILSIEKAVEAERFLSEVRVIRRGDPERTMAAAPFVRRGVCRSLGQEHFYFETQTALAIPEENGQMFVHAATQGPTETQLVVAAVLGLQRNQVVCENRRMGGGFGGKETQANLPAMMVALVAQRTGRAARIEYERVDDMRTTGKRHAFRAEWEVGFDGSGRVLAYRVHLLSDGGSATDLSPSVMDRAMLHADNAYFLEHVEIRGQVCFSNYAPATAFRGFGGPQSVAVIEQVMQEIALTLNAETNAGVTVLDVQERNLYGVSERNLTPYGQLVAANHLPALMNRLRVSSDFDARHAEILQANRHDANWLCGIAMTPVKFGISFVARFMNQANALVQVYPDGTVQVSTGGTEMGQGLATKIRQLVAADFGIPVEAVRMMTTSTEKNHNTSATAASASTDLNGAAALDASRSIRRRMAYCVASLWGDDDAQVAATAESLQFANGYITDIRHEGQQISFLEACAVAHTERIDLGARGFYATPGIHYDRASGRGSPFLYFTQGAAVAEVRIDRRTGALRVPRVDLLADIGHSINRGIDRGQLIGGFVQGMGWVTTECLVYDARGRLLSDSESTYKIPASTDAPEQFYCDTFDAPGPTETVARSKAVGEPPLLLGISVFMAVKHAVSSVSAHAARRLLLPATGEEILRALAFADTPLSASERWMHSSVSWHGIPL